MSFHCPYTTCPIIQNERLQRPYGVAILRTDDIEKTMTNAEQPREDSNDEEDKLYEAAVYLGGLLRDRASRSKDFPVKTVGDIAVMYDAANVIEQLLKNAEKWKLAAEANRVERDKCLRQSRELAEKYLRQSRELAKAWTNLSIARNWISVEEGFPEEDGDYFVRFANGSVAQMHLSITSPFLASEEGRKINGITHWMPFPNGLEEEKKNK